MIVIDVSDIFAAAAEIDRNGVVNARDYREDGTPVGGHLTWAAMGARNDCRHDLCERTGIDYADAIILI